MTPFSYSRVADDKAAVAAASAKNAKFLGGGTNLVDLMKHEIETAGDAGRRLAPAA